MVGTGKDHSVREVVEVAFNHVGLDPANYVRADPKHTRPAEVEELVADPTKAHEVLGWAPRTSFEELVRLMVEADLERLRARPTFASA